MRGQEDAIQPGTYFCQSCHWLRKTCSTWKAKASLRGALSQKNGANPRRRRLFALQTQGSWTKQWNIYCPLWRRWSGYIGKVPELVRDFYQVRRTPTHLDFYWSQSSWTVNGQETQNYSSYLTGQSGQTIIEFNMLTPQQSRNRPTNTTWWREWGWALSPGGPEPRGHCAHKIGWRKTMDSASRHP